jgi:hypothetical protein
VRRQALKYIGARIVFTETPEDGLQLANDFLGAVREVQFFSRCTFNHAQFDGAGSVDGNRDDATFGQILKSQPGRVSQVAIKFLF